MRKIAHSLFALAALLSATAFAAHPTGDYMTWFGSDAAKDVTNSSGSSFFGAWAGEGGEYINYSTYLGALSGYRSYNVNRSVGLGPWALREARNVYGTVAIGTSAGRGIEGCTNCVFIGANAGRSHRGLKDWVDIDGLIRISDGENGRQFDLRFSRDDDPVVSLYGYAFHRNLILEPGTEINCTGWNIHRSGLADFSRANISEGVSYVTEVGCGYGPYISLGIESGCLCVYTNSVCAATFEPKRTTPPKSLEIEDEDTGEKYIIKVKSGALKLYKVEETEE